MLDSLKSKQLPGLWLQATGLATLISAGLWFKLLGNLRAQVAVPRVIGVMAVIALVLGGLALVPAWLTSLRRGEGSLPGRIGRLLAYAAVLASLVLVGLTVFYGNPRSAPQPLQLGSALACLALAVAFWWRPRADQALALRMLGYAGFSAWLTPLLLSPWTAYGYSHDVPSMPGAPAPMSGPVKADAPRRIILISFDALRVRSTSLRDPKRNLTPHLAELARSSTYFPRLRASADLTLNAVPTFLSGIGPRRYMRDAVGAGSMMRSGYLTGIAGHLASAGYRATYATMGISPAYLGFGQEFEDGFADGWFFDPAVFNAHAYLPLVPAFRWLGLHLVGRGNDNVHDGISNPKMVRANFQHATELLAAKPGRNFVWVHVGAPHAPYFDIPAADVGGKLDGHYERLDYPAMVRARTKEELRRIERIYEHYVTFADGELGLFVADLKARKLWDDSLVIVTSDHGEDFTQLGFSGHANGILTEDVSCVPLLVHLPGQQDARRDMRACSHGDLLPTVLMRVYGRVPEGLQGHDLLGPPVPDRLLYSWALEYRYAGLNHYPAALAAYRDHFKYLVSYRQRHRLGDQLFDLAHDRQALHDVAARHPKELDWFRKRVAQDVNLYEQR